MTFNHFKLISIHFCDVMMKVSVFYPYFWRHPEYTSCTSHSLKFKAVISLSWLKRSELHATSARTLRPRHVVRSLCGPAGHGGHSPGQAIVIVINRKAMYNSFSRLSGSFLHHAKHIKHANQARMPRGLSQCRALGQLQGEFQFWAGKMFLSLFNLFWQGEKRLLEVSISWCNHRKRILWNLHRDRSLPTF